MTTRLRFLLLAVWSVSFAAYSIGQSSNAQLFNLHIQSGTTPWPAIGFNNVRLFSNVSPYVTRWSSIATSSNISTWNWTPLDNWLAELYSHGITDGVLYTFDQVPPWASSNNMDASCDFSSGGNKGGCDLPSDIISDGSGTDTTFKTFVSAIGNRVNDPAYRNGTFPYTTKHAHIKYWEPWNEIYRNNVVNSWTGSYSVKATYAQLVRMAEDVRCTITGSGSVMGTACSAPVIDSGAIVVSPSDGAITLSPGSTMVFQNFLYCNGTGSNAPIPGSECITGPQGSAAVDVINTHFYEPAPENLTSDVPTYQALLSPTDLTKPFWSGEGSWGNDSNISSDPDTQASWVARYYLVGWSTGLARMYWYAYDSTLYGTLWNSSSGLLPPGVAYGTVHNWIVGSALTKNCGAVGASTVWTCGLTLSTGFSAFAVWDTSQSCSNSTGTEVCTYSTQTISTSWTKYQDLTGATHTISPLGSVQVGIEPILLETH